MSTTIKHASHSRADVTARKETLLKMIRSGKINQYRISHVVDKLKISTPTLYKYLKDLTEAGLIGKDRGSWYAVPEETEPIIVKPLVEPQEVEIEELSEVGMLRAELEQLKQRLAVPPEPAEEEEPEETNRLIYVSDLGLLAMLNYHGIGSIVTEVDYNGRVKFQFEETSEFTEYEESFKSGDMIVFADKFANSLAEVKRNIYLKRNKT